MRTRPHPRSRVAIAALVLLLGAGCSDDDGDTPAPGTTTSSTAPEATTTSTVPVTTTVGPSTTLSLPEDAKAARAVVRDFAERQVGMVDPVLGATSVVDSSPRTARVEVRPRREDGTVDPSLPATTVELVADGNTWRIVSASSEHLTIDSPPPAMRLSAGFVTPSGTATAFEGTVIVQALRGTDVLDEVVTTADAIENGFWAARLELGRAQGDGYILAFTTAGTETGPPAFALVPVVYGEAG